MIPALSFVIPLYNSEATIAALVGKIAVLDVAGGLEIILVNDGSADSTSAIYRGPILSSHCRLSLSSTRGTANATRC